MLNVEATLGLWLLRNMNNWKKLVKGLIQRPLNPVESLLMSCGLCLGPYILQPGDSSRRLQAARPARCTASSSRVRSSAALARGRAGGCLEVRDGSGSGAWRWERCLGFLTWLMWRA